jgi:hypothetical protein
MSSLREHRFAGQRTGLESPPVVSEHIHNALNYFLRETHTPPVDFGGDCTEIDGGLGFDDLWLAEVRFTPSTKCVA